MRIRRATTSDIPGIHDLLSQVLEIHHAGRPDIFKAGTQKYTNDQLTQMVDDDTRPIFVAVDEQAEAGTILGYAFCIHQEHPDDNILTNIRTLYIDDLCVDRDARGKHVGTSLYQHVLEYARTTDCYNVTLNVWACNESARLFYERLGLTPQKIGMEHILR